MSSVRGTGAAGSAMHPARLHLDRALRWLLYLAVAVAVVPFGSTGEVAMPIALASAATWCALAAVLPGRAFPVPSLVAIWVAAGLGGFMWLQASFAPGLPRAAAFSQASALLGQPLAATPSIAPAQTLQAIAPVVVPLLVFALSLRILRTDRSAQGVLRFLSLFGGGVALFGILQHQLTPDLVLLSEKTSYQGDLTAVFVNRNTAATFLGGTVLIALSIVAYEIGRRPTLATILTVSAHREDRALALHGIVALTALVALAMTSSRAGGTATLVATMLLVALLYRKGSARPGERPRPRASMFRRWVAVLAIGSSITLLFGGRILDRMVTRGTDDARFCVYPDIWRLARTVWPWGSGAGTFELAFRPFRDPACGIHGIWDRAHSFFLEGLVVMGAPFCVAAAVSLWTLAATLRRGWRTRRGFRSGPAFGISFAVLIVLHDLVDFSVQITGVALWAAVALAAACALCDREQAGTDRPVTLK